MKFNLSADVVEINRYQFEVESCSKKEAETKLKLFLKNNCPDVHQFRPIDGIICVDREAAMETRETKSIRVN